ncbi:MAG: hypothetical protein V7727_03330 [Sneathiella sp.]
MEIFSDKNLIRCRSAVGIAILAIFLFGVSFSSADEIHPLSPKTKEEAYELVRPLGDAVKLAFRREIQWIQSNSNDKEQYRRANKIDGCPTQNNDQIDPEQRKFQEIKKIGLKTNLIIFEGVVIHYKEIMDVGGNDTKKAAEAYVCKKLMPEFRFAFLAAYPKWSKKGGGVLAKWGFYSLADSAPFLAKMNDYIGEHIYGHSEITSQAIRALHAEDKTNFNPSLGFYNLMMAASQAPDTYGWDNDAYHAHSAHYECCNQEDRKNGMKAGQKEFINLFKHHYNLAIREKRTPVAAIHMGALLHMVQDLVYHRGITLIQHAGLSYVLGQDPDSPEGAEKFPVFEGGSAAESRFNEAVLLSKNILSAVFLNLHKNTKKQLMNWKHDNNYNINTSMVIAYRKELNEKTVAIEMGVYVASSMLYTFHFRNPDIDLVEDDRTGLAYWNLEETVKLLSLKMEQ